MCQRPASLFPCLPFSLLKSCHVQRQTRSQARFAKYKVPVPVGYSYMHSPTFTRVSALLSGLLDIKNAVASAYFPFILVERRPTNEEYLLFVYVGNCSVPKCLITGRASGEMVGAASQCKSPFQFWPSQRRRF